MKTLIENLNAKCAVIRLFGIASVFVLTGCGGGGGGAAPAAQSLPVTGDSAPVISGSPTTSVTQDVSYSFVPTASDPDGDSLSFNISSRPLWASFNSNTGALTGTPDANDVGTYPNITITVMANQVSESLPPFAINVVGTSTGAATLNWTPPTQNSDNSTLTDLAGYRVRYGTAPNSYSNSQVINNSGVSSYMVENLTPATWYFVVTAFDTSGNESVYSDMATKSIN